MVNKQILVTWLLLATPGRWCDGSCATDEFAIASSICCAYCAPGWFVTANCTKTWNGQTGTTCQRCGACGFGQRTVSHCTPFSNTVCENQVHLTTPVTVAMTPRLPEILPVSVIYTVSLYVVPSVVLLLILVSAAWKWRSAHRPSADPAREPFNIQKLGV